VSKYLFYLLLLATLGSCAKPMADFLLTTDSSIAPAAIQVENKSVNAESYLWDFGDGTTSTELNPEHNYSLSGRYVVTLSAIGKNKTDVKAKEIVFDPPKDCYILMKTTLGDLVLKLYDDTPLHRDNILKLIQQNYYDGLLFHRVIKGFMVQGGDPNSKNAGADTRLGSGGPGYTIPAEISNNRVHFKGALAAARQGDQVNPKKNSSGSQFYIVQGGPVGETTLNRQEQTTGVIYSDELREKYYEVGGTPALDFNYTVFGQVVEGLDIIDKIASTATLPGDRPVEDVKIISVELIR